ncbi:prostaglandin G/H synthase 2-like [Hetaerina americana]|uniref:prostaglandin G/H synthase 2-like n=1 Tax=Hetaerina americana TaxID=62018 RepID=UPI003A7F3A95
MLTMLSFLNAHAHWRGFGGNPHVNEIWGAYDPCCAFPCHNGGICSQKTLHSYECDCTDLGYHGSDCRRLGFDSIDNPLRYNVKYDYPTYESHFESNPIGRILPQVPVNCPTPMGVLGPKLLPDESEVFEKIFRRKRFKPDPSGSNLFFVMFTEHLSYMLFKEEKPDDYSFSKLPGGISYLKNHHNHHPPIPKKELLQWKHQHHQMKTILKRNFLILISTIWIREHNRVAEILSYEHPDWDDERIYQVTRLVITGELIHITMTDYLQQLTQYNFEIIWKPDAFNHEVTYQPDRINVELHQLKHWHAMFPDCLKLGNTTYNITETYYNNKILTIVGFDDVLDILMRTPAGKVSSRNYADYTRNTIIDAIREGRKYRLQSLNNYRKHLGLDPYKSMFELCGEQKLSKDLQLFYGDINAVELFTGIAAEKPRCSVLSQTQMALGGPYIIKSLLSNPINSRGWWKPSTFGGPIGYDIVKGATIKELICKNRMKSCKGEELLSFHVPTKKELEAELARKKSRLWCLDEEDFINSDTLDSV